MVIRCTSSGEGVGGGFEVETLRSYTRYEEERRPKDMYKGDGACGK